MIACTPITSYQPSANPKARQFCEDAVSGGAEWPMCNESQTGEKVAGGIRENDRITVEQGDPKKRANRR